MHVTLIGATGSVGRLTLTSLRAAGHDVTVLARDPARLPADLTDTTVIAGDVLDPEAVATAIRGRDAVIVTLGAGMNLRSRIRSRGTLAVIEAMHREGVRRLICQSTLGAHESWSNLNFYWKRIMFGALLRRVHQDHQVQEDIVRASGLDWTIVRPSAFTDAPASGAFREAFAPSERDLRMTIPRADIASFLTRQVSELTYMNRAVGISH